MSEGKELTEIGEMMCDHCLAPDSEFVTGCDNMTVLIVAILGGRTKEEWYSWVTDRVKQKYGYETPNTLPQIYAQSRIMAFKSRQTAQAERDRMRAEREESGEANGLLSAGSAFGGFTKILGSTSGISFHPGSGIMSGTGGLMFGNDDSDDDDDDGDEGSNEDPGHSFFSNTLGIGGQKSEDATSNLKAQLDDFERDIRDDDSNNSDDDGKSGGPFGMDGISGGKHIDNDLLQWAHSWFWFT